MRINWPLFNNIRLLHMACVPVVIFYLVGLVNTSERVRGDEGALLDLICWPDGNVIPVIIACGSVFAVFVQLYGLYQLFKAGISKTEVNVNKGLLSYICALMMLIIIYLFVIFYAALQSSILREAIDSFNISSLNVQWTENGPSEESNPTECLRNYICQCTAKIKDGISKAMQQYAFHLASKTAIDKLQTRFQCCGRLNYKEWFYIPWAQLKPTEALLKSNKFVADNVPFSCCSMDVMWPCVHHGVQQIGTIYKYNPEKQLTIWTFGCEEKLVTEMAKVSWRFVTVMSLITIAMILQCIATRYLQTAYTKGLHYGNQITCEAYLLRESTKENRTRNWLLRRRESHTNKRIIDWVTIGRRVTAEPDACSSDSDIGSADQLLKPHL